MSYFLPLIFCEYNYILWIYLNSEPFRRKLLTNNVNNLFYLFFIYFSPQTEVQMSQIYSFDLITTHNYYCVDLCLISYGSTFIYRIDIINYCRHSSSAAV